MAMRAIETERMMQVSRHSVIRPVDIFSMSDMDAFMETFDQAVTVGEDGWDMWVKRHGVDVREVGSEDALLVCHLGLSPYLKDPFNRGDLIEATHLVSSITHGSEQDYLDFLFFLMSGDGPL